MVVDGSTIQLIRNCLTRDGVNSPVRREILELLESTSVGYDDFVEMQKPEKEPND